MHAGYAIDECYGVPDWRRCYVCMPGMQLEVINAKESPGLEMLCVHAGYAT